MANSGHFSRPGKVAKMVHGKGRAGRNRQVSIRTGGHRPTRDARQVVRRNNRMGRSDLRPTTTGFEGTVRADQMNEQCGVPRQVAAAQGLMHEPTTITTRDRRGRQYAHPVKW